MAYVEYLRVRRALIVFTIVVLAIVSIVVASLNVGHVRMNESDIHAQNAHIPLTFVLAVPAFAALIFGTLLSGSLNRERETLALSWTRPIVRQRLALGYMLVDFGAVFVAFLIALGLGILPALTTGFFSHIYVDRDAANAVIGIFGVTLMWYGLVQAATSWFRGRAGLVVGMSWAVFIGLIALGHFSAFGPLVSGIATTLNYLNPLAYISSEHFDNATQLTSSSAYLDLSENVRAAVTWFVGLVACAIAIFGWTRSEA